MTTEQLAHRSPDRPGDRIADGPAETVLPLTPAQRRLWALAHLRPGDPFFSIPFAVTAEGPLDTAALRRALDELLRRHEALRVRITHHGGEPAQTVTAPAPLPLPLVDCAGSTETADARAEAFARVPFDLDGGPLIRAELLRIDDRTHRLLVGVHHIVFDGSSLEILTAELAALYEAFARGLPSPLPAPAVPYTAFLARRTEADERTGPDRLRHWTARLAGAPEVLELPLDRPRPVHGDHRGARRTTVVPHEVVEPLRRLARTRRSTLFMVLKAAFDVALGTYGGHDVLTGMAVSGRDTSDSAGVVGYLARPVVLRADLSDDPVFTDLLARVRGDVLDAHDHADLPFDEVIDALGLTRDPSHHPLYQVMFSHQRASTPAEAAGVRLTTAELRLPTMKTDLAVDTLETDAGLLVLVDYRTDLFDAATADRLLDRLRTVLIRVAADPDARVTALRAPDRAELHRLVEEWNPDRDEPADTACLHALVEEQTARTPDAVAVDTAAGPWTYRELDTAATGLAHRLRELGVTPETPVGVCAATSPQLVAALLGVLKAGGVCVPLDPALPAFRLRTTIDDLGIGTVVTDRRAASLFDRNRLTVVDAERTAGAAAPGDGTTPPVRTDVTAHHAAWILHTAGTEGEPRPVVAEHRNLVGRLRWIHRSLPEGAPPVTAPAAAPGSYASVLELFAPLTGGGRLVLAGSGTPTLHVTTPEAPGERRSGTVLTGGALLVPEAVRETHGAGAGRILHAYAAAETAGPALGGPAVPGEPVTLGVPAGCTAYVLDPHGSPVPPGATGELHIGGPAVTRGYAGDPRRTAERYRPDPFGSVPGGRLYATGDLARHDAEGRLVYEGRAADRIHVRSVRVSPKDLEAALLAHPAVARAVAFPAGDGTLAAAVSPRPGAAPDERTLRTYLRERLPGALQPDRLAVLPRLPLLPAGTPDRTAVARALAEAAARPAEERPPSGTERIVAEAWRHVLGRTVGTGENFFDAGGNSLLLIRLRERLEDGVGRPVRVVDLFRHSTVRAMAAFLAAPDGPDGVPADSPAGEADGGADGTGTAPGTGSGTTPGSGTGTGAGDRARARREALRARGRARRHTN
ncbi:condensation domain-containing protein [Streptomyces roseolus]|uniref:non-ribosomal peptide synthetase n=1 Tax=Streptomyces roseolus TaxID=67358 RepID=UPI0036FE5F04